MRVLKFAILSALSIPLGLAGTQRLAAQSVTGSADASSSNDQLSELVVTARRQKETLLDVPESVTALGSTAIAELNIQSFDDYALKIPNLSFSYGTGGLGYGGSRTVAIRGISGAGTTGFYIDDTPVPDSIDPQVVDIERIEVLKGPQGTLFGEGSLGGNVRLITKQPSFAGRDESFAVQGGYTDGGGSPDYRADVIENFVLADDTLALRIIGFGDHESGFITRTYPSADFPGRTESSADQGATTTTGGSLSALYKVSDNFHALARFMMQRNETDGLAAPYAPLPGFQPTSYTLNREANVPEGTVDWFYLPSLELHYQGTGWSLVSSTSDFRRRTTNLEDGTEGTQQAIELFYGGTSPLGTNGIPWTSFTDDSRLQEEVRLSFEGGSHLSGVVGTRYSKDKTDGAIDSGNIPGIAAEYGYPTDLAWYDKGGTTTQDTSVFGEGYVKYGQFELTLGLRQYWLKQSGYFYAAGLLNGGVTNDQGLQSSASGLNPRVALSFKPTEDNLVYASAAKGYRQGGPNASVGAICDGGIAELGLNRADIAETKPDTVWNYEVGAKSQVGKLTMSGALFQMNWTNIQQSLTIPQCYITVTANAGAARNRGAEFELSGIVYPGLEIRVGAGYDDAKITEGGYSGQLVGSRVYQVPRETGFAAATYTHALSAKYDGFVSIDDSYTGSSLSGTTLSGPAALTRGGYDVLNARLGVHWKDTELALYAKNLLNKEANLGDINPISYVRREDDGTAIPRVAVLPPLQLGLQFKYGFK